MARAVSTVTGDEMAGGGVMLLAVDFFLWRVLLAQASLEECSPGAVLSKAVGQYLAQHGDEETNRLFAGLDGD